MQPSTAPPERLPRGKHSLPRETVAESQRSRIIRGMVTAVAEAGYGEARVVDVIEIAGVSRKTFYELFADKEGCFLAAYDLVAERFYAAAATAYESAPDEPWAERIRLGLTAFLQALAENPAEARLYVVEALAAGNKALTRRDAAIRRFSSFIDAGRSETSIQLPGITSLAIVGGINELLYSEIIHGATAQLPGQLPELIFWITHPILGTEKAAKERDRARDLLASPAGAG